MSAWIVSRTHIDALVTALCEGEIVTDRSPDEVGRTLWAECLASVAYRYPSDGDGERPGPVDFRDADVQTYTYERLPVPHGWLPVLAACYDYQSCEHPGWDSSEAHGWTAALLVHLKRSGYTFDGPGSKDAPWGLDRREQVPA